MTDVCGERCRLSWVSRLLLLSVLLISFHHADAYRISTLRRSHQVPDETEHAAVYHSRRVLSLRDGVEGLQRGGCRGDCGEDHGREFDARFKRHLRLLFTSGTSSRKLGDDASSIVSSVQEGDGASWARRLVCEPGCLHGGICQLDGKTKEPGCLCPLPDPDSGVYFRGSSCQTQAVRCNSTFWCENEGACSKLDDAPAGEDLYACTCPAGFQGSKCQTPVTPCGVGASDLWCANGGLCEFSPEANTTICKCPSTHAGTNCETLVEPQDLDRAHRSHSNFTSPVIVPADADVERLQVEQQKYFKAFFLIFGVFLTIWMTALAAVHCPRPRSQLKRKMAALRGELTPLKPHPGTQPQAQAQAQAQARGRAPGQALGALKPSPGLHKVQVVERYPGASPARTRPEAGPVQGVQDMQLGEGARTSASGSEGDREAAALGLPEAQAGDLDVHVPGPLRAAAGEVGGQDRVQEADEGGGGHRTPPPTPDASDRAPGESVSPGMLQGS